MDISHMGSKGVYYHLWQDKEAVVNYSQSGMGYFGRHRSPWLRGLILISGQTVSLPAQREIICG